MHSEKGPKMGEKMMYLTRRKQASEGEVQKTRGGRGKGQIPQSLLGQS